MGGSKRFGLQMCDNCGRDFTASKGDWSCDHCGALVRVNGEAPPIVTTVKLPIFVQAIVDAIETEADEAEGNDAAGFGLGGTRMKR